MAPPQGKVRGTVPLALFFTVQGVMSVADAPVITRSKEFERQVLEHVDMLYAVALRLTRNPADAEDLTQNTFVKALRFHDKFKEGTYIKAVAADHPAQHLHQ